MRAIWEGKITGLENIPRTTPCIVVSNHASYLDFILLNAIFEKRCGKLFRFWAKTGVIQHPLFGPFAKAFGCIEVGMGNKADLLPKSRECLSRGESLCIFPEGTRSRNGQPGKFRMRYLKLANREKIQVVPAAISNTYQVWPPHRIIPRPGKCGITFFPGIDFDGSKSEKELEQLNKQIQSQINDHTPNVDS